MKVYHSIELLDADPEDREVDIFQCESQAYARLKAHGLCAKGYVPNFYGLIKQINPKQWSPYLSEFLKDPLPPNAVLLEYIPGLKKIDLLAFSWERVFLWIDFDRAKTFSHDSITDRQREWVQEEIKLIQCFLDALLWIDEIFSCFKKLTAL
ncbi:hypothetical protein BDV32DRAFT_138621 [Aspergillus pseudonomiae]|nr:hypothetical protein BDV32DRAFT_138621 [Aspergillus pseudonomiae]